MGEEETGEEVGQEELVQEEEAEVENVNCVPTSYSSTNIVEIINRDRVKTITKALGRCLRETA